MSESFAALFEESLQRTEMRPGEVITAEVVRIEHNFVVVNAGLKSESYVAIDEFKNDQGGIEVQVGDFVSVAIGSIENGYGDTILSPTPPSAWPPGCRSKKPWNPANSSPAPPAARSRAA